MFIATYIFLFSTDVNVPEIQEGRYATFRDGGIQAEVKCFAKSKYTPAQIFIYIKATSHWSELSSNEPYF